MIFTITRIERKTRITFHKINDIGQKIITLIYKFVSRFLAYKKLIKSRKNENSMCYLFDPRTFLVRISSVIFFFWFFYKIMFGKSRNFSLNDRIVLKKLCTDCRQESIQKIYLCHFAASTVWHIFSVLQIFLPFLLDSCFFTFQNTEYRE